MSREVSVFPVLLLKMNIIEGNMQWYSWEFIPKGSIAPQVYKLMMKVMMII